MITLTNFSSGELLITNGAHSFRLPHDAAHRLVLHARMHNVGEFAEALPKLINDPQIVQAIGNCFESAKDSTERWNLKEKFARLRTLAKDSVPAAPPEPVEVIQLSARDDIP